MAFNFFLFCTESFEIERQAKYVMGSTNAQKEYMKGSITEFRKRLPSSARFCFVHFRAGWKSYIRQDGNRCLSVILTIFRRNNGRYRFLSVADGTNWCFTISGKL